MLIDFSYLWNKYNIDAKGVLHVGASTGQEAEAYYANGIERSIWIEAIPSVYETLKENLKGYPNSIAINACIGEEENKEVIFHVSSNKGESSSYLELGTHAIVHSDVKYIEDIKCVMRRMDNMFIQTDTSEDFCNVRMPDNEVIHFFSKYSEYTFLNIDLQGAELYALKGMGEMLKKFKYAYLEVNKEHLYIGCPLVQEIDEYMASFGFVGVEELWAGNTGWGDKFYIKKELL